MSLGVIPDRVRCLFCRGKKCKYEDFTLWSNQRNTHQALVGVHSNWVTDHVVAMARPSQRVIEEHDLIRQFKELGIGAVLNLQEQGEHKACGDGLVDSGFSYDPEAFMKANSTY